MHKKNMLSSKNPIYYLYVKYFMSTAIFYRFIYSNRMNNFLSCKENFSKSGKVTETSPFL